MRQKLRFTAVLVVLLIILGTASYREQGKRQKLSFPESLDLVVVTVDGEQVTLREMAFYIAYEEGSMEDAAIIYNPDNTDEYWRLYTNHTFLREQAKQTVLDMTVHDTLFSQMAAKEGVVLSEAEEQYLANEQQDFWSDLTEEQRESLSVSEDTLDETMRKMALAQKYQSILAEMEQVDYEDYSIGGTEYEKLLAQHTCELDETTWERVPFGSITVDH
ncbi:MAG: hypothetical protein PUA99_06710 [Roseburia hominis]|uniref:hypothetical protein n=1 Tax=Roseburia hominis TaxID=301301 RepID=UPI0026E92FB5|nr:hypothetical protein [Roseburia hominis]MCI7523998.1 hypothetical protein [Roseburia hominis]MDD6242799.1 hypothetical protein [Roseburia hominis]